ncbi:response regulator [Paenibacillus amylolyticus]|nr:response regulator [Paenibacillus amylolyticus]
MMIVDDEIGIRENIRSCIDWEKEGFHYCGDAPDGELALPLIHEWAPDILITDIKMPFMNGLELTSIVRTQQPDIKIIIMSGHDEFSYAQEAIRLGVTEYCLKPISAAELIQMLHKVSKQMDEEHQRMTNRTIIKEKLLADLCGGLIGTTDAIESAKQLSLPLSARFYTIVIIDVRLTDESRDSESLMKKLIPILEETRDPHVELLPYIRSRTELVLLLKYHSDDSISVYLEQLHGAGFVLNLSIRSNVILFWALAVNRSGCKEFMSHIWKRRRINILIDSPFRTELLYMKLTWMSKRLFFSTGIRFLNFSKSAAPICVTILCRSLPLHYSPSTGSPPRMASIC